MHKIELDVINFMKTVSTQSLDTTNMLLKPAEKDIQHFLKKMYEENPNRPFSLRLSAIGRPLCMQQMHRNKEQGVDDDWNFPLRMMYGGVIEGLAVSILRHAGVKIQEEQTNVKLQVVIKDTDIHPRHRDIYSVPGTLDLVIDEEVWDVKSASPYSYEEKFMSYETVKQNDDFGYLPQLYGYAAARGKKPGGWIVIDKSSGEMKVITVPVTWEEEQKASLDLIKNNVKILVSNAEFKRCYEDKDEKFKKRLTGNKILQSPCTFCKYKYKCWPEVKHLPDVNSKAFDKPYKYYTVLNV